MNSLNGINNVSLYTAGTAANNAVKNTAVEKVEKTETATDDNIAAVYTPSSAKDDAASSTAATTQKTTDRAAIIAQIKADDAAYTKQMQDMVKNLITKQGQTYDMSGDNIWKVLQDPDFLKNVDKDTIDKAKEAISDNGYYGVKQTSDRIITFAKALAGDDTSKADKLINAFKEGYKQAEKVWGNKLPDISKKTYDAVIKKFDDWKNGTENTDTSTNGTTSNDTVKKNTTTAADKK